MITGYKVELDWNRLDNTYEEIKYLMGRQVLLGYPNFLKVPHMDANKTQLGNEISKVFKAIYFYLSEMGGAQTQYTISEKNIVHSGNDGIILDHFYHSRTKYIH